VSALDFDRIANALRETMISPNEPDTNLEPSNVVDGLFRIARAIDHLAAVIGDREQEK
jgi:hypothetical protein